MAAATLSKPIKPKVTRQQEVFKNDKKVRDYVICQIRNGSKPEDDDIELLRWGRIALDQTQTKDWTTETLGLEGINNLKNSVKALYDFQDVFNRIQTYEDTFKAISIIESENIDEFTTRFNAWNTKPRKCELSPETKKREEKAIKEAATTKAAKTKEAEKKRKDNKKEKETLKKTADSNIKKDEYEDTLPPSHISSKAAVSPKVAVLRTEAEMEEDEKKKSRKAADDLRKAAKEKKEKAEKSEDKQADLEFEDAIPIPKASSPQKKVEKKKSEKSIRIEKIRELEKNEKEPVLEKSQERTSFGFEQTNGTEQKESTITISSLLETIQNNDEFIQAIVKNLKDLMKWKIERYQELLRKLFGNAKKLKEFIKSNKKKKNKDEKKNEREMSDEYKGRVYLLAQQACEKKKESLDEKSVRDNLFDALSNRQNGIISLQGKARENIRNQLLKTIISLSRNISRFKEGNNIILMGGSGSGKTKTASVIGYVYSKIGILANNTFRDVQPSSMMSTYHSGTTILTAHKILENLEGTMLIDEAYSFVPKCTNVSSQRNGGAEEQGSEAINQIVTMIDELKGLIVVILAGYEGAMLCVMKSNEGIERRFSTKTKLMDYKNWDLTQMLVKKIDNSIGEDSNVNVNKKTLKPEEIKFLFDAFSYLASEKKEVFAKQAGSIDLLSREFSKLLSEFVDEKDKQWKNDSDHIEILTEMFNNFLLNSNIKFKLVRRQNAPAPVYPNAPKAGEPPKGGYQNQTTWARFPKIRF